ncbi:MAG: hypothetical protein ACI82A_003374 [Candidatus Azotimanducaceae bacterium]|jgi:hypothetical protein
MKENLENLVKQAETDIGSHSKVRGKAKHETAKSPKFSLAITIWLFVILVGVYQFDTATSIFSAPTESKIESDLGGVLSNVAITLRNYQANTGSLPPILPNPAIRGLVKFDRRSDFSYQLTATISNVTMVMDSTSTSPYRQKGAD